MYLGILIGNKEPITDKEKELSIAFHKGDWQRKYKILEKIRSIDFKMNETNTKGKAITAKEKSKREDALRLDNQLYRKAGIYMSSLYLYGSSTPKPTRAVKEFEGILAMGNDNYNKKVSYRKLLEQKSKFIEDNSEEYLDQLRNDFKVLLRDPDHTRFLMDNFIDILYENGYDYCPKSNFNLNDLTYDFNERLDGIIFLFKKAKSRILVKDQEYEELPEQSEGVPREVNAYVNESYFHLSFVTQSGFEIELKGYDEFELSEENTTLITSINRKRVKLKGKLIKTRTTNRDNINMFPIRELLKKSK